MSSEPRAAKGHLCPRPLIAGVTVPVQPDWTCGQCGRVFRDCRTGSGLQWWAEIQGATR